MITVKENIMKKPFCGTMLAIVIPIFSFTYSSYAFDRIIIAPDGNTYFAPYNGKGNRYIAKYDKYNNKSSWEHPVRNQDNCHLSYISLDPTGSKITYVAFCNLTNTKSSESAAQRFYRLVIIDVNNSKEVASFDHGGSIFSFSPKGNAIVYAEEIPGERGSPAPPGYQGGVWLYNFNYKTNRMILPAPTGITDLNWSEHDGNIYLLINPQVIKYDLKRSKSDLVSYPGIYFSSDGKYNFSASESLIFRTQDNREMKDWENMIRNEGDYPDNTTFVYVCWSKKLNAAIFTVGNHKYVIFDPSQGKVIGSFRALFIGINGEGTKAAVHPLGSDRRAQFDKVQILNLLDLVQQKSGP